ncbi:MAG: aminoacyl-tRNA hydrolase [Spirochaetae bacterium HGW-Spirochaetae-8]|jgi:PTH1 family peptidyl-tRNA hydrolase|nr:MAG: aminoacyl-tRNA hydrolase [Spirochaetae bacterium HGW-Spirochaetae-8]
MVKLIALLGNKGILYRQTRHNYGWMFGEALSDHLGTPLSWQEKFHGVWCKCMISNLPIILLKPMTFMNESGRSIGEASRYFNIGSEEILVIHDDIELSFGTVKLQAGGGLAGHNGLKSTMAQIGSDHFLRFRLGIGRPTHGDVASFVLNRFSAEEEMKVPLVMQQGIRILESFLSQKCRPELLPIQEKIP